MDNFDNLIRQQSEYVGVRDDKYKNDSKERLSKILKKKVETTMIGALSSVEEHLSFLWAPNSEEMTPEQKIMYDLLAQYEIKWLRYNTTIPVKNTGEGNND